jgi:ubiquinone/menaquinone biosynthesis C-methylase UbiE
MTTSGASNEGVLARALPLLRLAPGASLPPVAGGVLDLLDPAFAPTATQRSLDTVATAWIYEFLRDRLVRWIGMPDFASEARQVIERLDLAPGDVVLDLACGHGNFSAEFARRVGPTGLVIGVDIAASMLARAAARMRRDGLDNVLLVRGDALALPFIDAAFAKLNCSGGLHQMPDLARALAELARVAKPGAHFAASGFARSDAGDGGPRGWLERRFALHVIPVAQLASAVERAGFEQVEARMAGAWFGYASARRPLAGA